MELNISTQMIKPDWARHEFLGSRLRDRRCVKSVGRIAQALSEHPGLSFSAATGPSLRQAGSRIFSNPQVYIANLQQGHYQQTLQRSIKAKVVLVSQDTTSVNYTSHTATEGLGPLDDKGKAQGLWVHTALVMNEQGLPLGVIGQAAWARSEKIGKRKKRKELPIEEKESAKWLRGLEWVNKRLAPQVEKVYLIQDREADVYEFFHAPREENVVLLVRAAQPRRVSLKEEGEEQIMTLPKALKYFQKVGEDIVQVERRNKTVEVKVRLSVGQVVVQPPQRFAKNPEYAPIPLNVVHVVELDENGRPAEKKNRIEWILLVAESIHTLADAQRIVRYYTYRWQVERLHYVLKSGFKVERLQFDDAHTLMNALAVYTVVAWQVLWVTHYGRHNPATPAQEVMEKESLEVLEAWHRKPIRTAEGVMYAVGRLGGFQGRTRRYKAPGVKSIWQGLRRLSDMRIGWRLAKYPELGKDYEYGDMRQD